MPITRAPVSSGGAPTDADYLVGTANGSLSAEIVVGTSPGGELGGTWASPTVASTHSGSAHIGDHTHAATGTGATGGGSTLSPILLSSLQKVQYTLLAPAQITASQNNYSPTGYQDYSFWYLDSSGAYDITGIGSPAAPANGTVLYLYNSSASTLTLKHESASSTAGNRLFLPSSADVAIVARAGVGLFYNAGRWRRFS